MSQGKRGKIMRRKRIFNYLSIICTLFLIINTFSLKNKAEACMENIECVKEEYCRKEDGDCDGEGTCESKPSLCLDIWDPVCGCDGETYQNSCFAAQAGVNVDYEGECTEGCSDNSDCQGGEYCAKASGDCDGEGTCNEKPEVCLPGRA